MVSAGHSNNPVCMVVTSHPGEVRKVKWDFITTIKTLQEGWVFFLKYYVEKPC